MITELNLDPNLDEEEKGDSDDTLEEADANGEGDSTDEEESDDDSSEEEESQSMSLEEYNKKVGKNYKSWDQVQKSELEQDKTISEMKESEKGAKKKPSKPRKTKTESSPVDSPLVEELYLESHPEYAHVKGQAEEIAQAEGITPIQAFRKYGHLQKEALAIAKEQEENAGNKKKISDPSHPGTGKKDFEKITDQDISNMTPEERVKLAEEQEKKELKRLGKI